MSLEQFMSPGVVRRRAIVLWRKWRGKTISESVLVNAQGRRDFSGLSLPEPRFRNRDAHDAATVEICERLIAAYRRATARGGTNHPSGNGIWREHADTFQRELGRALATADVGATSAILRRMFVDPVTTGLALGSMVCEWARTDQYATCLQWHDKAIALGLSLGAIPVQCPEQGEYGSVLDRDSVAVLERVQMTLGVDLTPPQVGAIFGVDVGGNAWPINYLLHVYTANRIRALIGMAGEEWDCIEIGGGVGFLAYAALVLGARRFCIVDLPIVNALQGYYLLRSRFADRVRLHGEAPSGAGNDIELVPARSIEEIDARSFAIAVNQDSMPEMAHETARNYVGFAAKVARRYFLSINQEAQAQSRPDFAQGWVHPMCKEEPALSLLYRVPYWLRSGYVEEVYWMDPAR